MCWLIGRQVSRLSRRQTERYIVGFIGPAAGQFVGKEAGILSVKQPENLSVAGNMIGFIFNGPAAGEIVG